MYFLEFRRGVRSSCSSKIYLFIIIIIIIIKVIIVILLHHERRRSLYNNSYYALNIYKLLLTPHAKISSSGCHATCKMFDEKSLKFW